MYGLRGIYYDKMNVGKEKKRRQTRNKSCLSKECCTDLTYGYLIVRMGCHFVSTVMHITTTTIYYYFTTLLLSVVP